MRYSPILQGMKVNGNIRSDGESLLVILLYLIKSIDDDYICKLELEFGKPYTITVDKSKIPYSANIDYAPVNDTN